MRGDRKGDTMSTFSFTNTESGKVTVPTTDLGVMENYAKTADQPTIAILSNKTCTLDQGELLTYRANDIGSVTTSLKSRYPAPVQSGVQYVIKLEELMRTVQGDGTYMDEPIVAYVTIRHPKSGNITQEVVNSIFSRLLGAIYKEDGTTRFQELMRSALVPTED